VPRDLCIELKSLKHYIADYHNRSIFYEAVTNQILDDLVGAARPRRMTVVGDAVQAASRPSSPRPTRRMTRGTNRLTPDARRPETSDDPRDRSEAYLDLHPFLRVTSRRSSPKIGAPRTQPACEGPSDLWAEKGVQRGIVSRRSSATSWSSVWDAPESHLGAAIRQARSDPSGSAKAGRYGVLPLRTTPGVAAFCALRPGNSAVSAMSETAIADFRRACVRIVRALPGRDRIDSAEHNDVVRIRGER
jgi:hypothetical protein